MIKYKIYDHVKEEYIDTSNVINGIFGVTPEGSLFKMRYDGTFKMMCVARYSIELIDIWEV